MLYHRQDIHSNYDGSHGFVARVDAGARELVAIFDGREVAYGFGELDALVLAYARRCTRRSGRNTAPSSPGPDAALAMLARNLLYTGVTRGKRLRVRPERNSAIT